MMPNKYYLERYRAWIKKSGIILSAGFLPLLTGCSSDKTAHEPYVEYREPYYYDEGVYYEGNGRYHDHHYKEHEEHEHHHEGHEGHGGGHGGHGH